MANQTSALLGEAPTPAITTALAAAYGMSYLAVSIHMASICATSLVCILLARETFRGSLVEQPAAGLSAALADDLDTTHRQKD